MTPLPALIGITEIRAEFLPVDRQTIVRYAEEGRCPAPVEFTGPRGRKLWRRDDWQLWVEKGCPNRAAFERYKRAELRMVSA
ncbi:MAG: helix-turn-helix transcriptional regulator [Phycisphaerae bacterium]